MIHHVNTMLELQFRRSERSRKWLKAYSAHTQARATVEREAPLIAEQDGWAEWRIVEVSP